MYKVTYMITSFNRISRRTLRKKDTINAFADSFRRFAATHLEGMNATLFSQIGQVLAISLLNNADLNVNTLTNAKIQLVSLVKDRCNSEMESPLMIVKIEHLEPLLDSVGKLNEKLTIFVADPRLIQGDTEFLAMKNTWSLCAKDLKP